MRGAVGDAQDVRQDVRQDVVVIGAGPAGLAAATLLAQHGAAVLVVDEHPAPGGQAHRGPGGLSEPDGRALLAAFEASAALCWSGATAWHLEAGTVWVSRDGSSVPVRTRVVILATGAMERPVPVPGWTLPGVFGAGALHALLRSSGLIPDEPVVLAGSGPLLALVAEQFLAFDVPLAAILATGGRTAGTMRHLPAALTGEGARLLGRGLATLWRLRRSGVPIHRGVSALRIEGGTRVEAVSFTKNGRRGTVPCRIVGLHEGVIPATQAAVLAGCGLRWDAGRRCFEPIADPFGGTSVPGLLVAGDGAGIEGAGAAAARGRLAAWDALRQLGRIDAATRDRDSAADQRTRNRHLAIRPLLDALHPPSPAMLSLADDVTVCRCEEITAGDIRAAAAGARTLDQLKGSTRCGMGPCQGRLCGPVAAELLAHAHHAGMEEVGLFRVRPPLKPIPVAELASLARADGTRLG